MAKIVIIKATYVGPDGNNGYFNNTEYKLIMKPSDQTMIANAFEISRAIGGGHWVFPTLFSFLDVWDKIQVVSHEEM